MAIVIPKVTKELKYTPTSQLSDPSPFTVTIKPIDIRSLLILEDRVVKRDGESITYATGKYAFDVCKAALVSWDNIVDASGKPVEFVKGPDGLPTDETIALLGIDIITEISNIVSAISRDSSKIPILFPDA